MNSLWYNEVLFGLLRIYIFIYTLYLVGNSYGYITLKTNLIWIYKGHIVNNDYYHSV